MRHSLRAAARTGLLLVVAVSAGLGGYLVARTEDGASSRSGPTAIESIATKKSVAHELVERRLTLPDAVERFRAINEARPGFSWQALRTTLPGATDDECLGHQVVGYAAEELRDHPERAEALVARLDAELAAAAVASSGAPGQ